MTLRDFHALAHEAGLAFELHSAQLARMAAYFEHRARWARVHNLSGPATLRDPWQTDALDAVAVRQCLQPELALVDVGTGNGVPGLLLACLEPERPVWLVEPRLKRVAFLRSTAAALGLTRVELRRTRWPCPVGEPFEVVSRAVVSPSAWPTLATQGEPPAGVVRMLADERPPFSVPGWQIASAVDYRSQGRDLRVERWIPGAG